MKLHFSTLSPFARKVRICAAELGLEEKIELVPTHVTPGKANTEYASRFNPLRRIPSLTLSDGSTLVDSKTICEYLDSLDGRGQLVPKGGARRWRVLSDYAIADGIIEVSLLLRYETALRPQAHQWPEVIADHKDKISSALGWFNERIETEGDRFELSQITLACALGYLDFRFADFGWREKHPALAAWHEKVSQRASCKNTEPAD
ncbi:MAG: glutathione S-transferase family protein [Burkholderiaceae bacterium]